MNNSQEYEILLKKLHDAKENNDINSQIDSYFKLSDYHYNNSDFQKARLLLKNILEINKTQPGVYYFLSLIDINQNKYEKAIENLKKELKINPQNTNAKKLKQKLTIKTNIPLITILLFILNFITFVFVYPKISFLNSIKYGLSSSNLNLINAITSIFFHINIYHFLFNMIILIAFGLILEKYIGSIKFLTIYLLSGIIGNFMEAFLAKNIIVLGASGALFGILGALMMREPLLKVRLFGIIKTPIILVLGGFFFITFILENFFTNIIATGNIAHYSGLLVGIFLIAIFYTETIEVYYNWLFITFGFYLIEYSIKNLIIQDFFYLIPTISFAGLIFIGIIMISYSYLKLKTLQQIGGLESESIN
jgi:membrane associated rhomboid family serine protease